MRIEYQVSAVAGGELAASREGQMQRRISIVLTLGLLLSSPVLAKDKDDNKLPVYILTAHTVSVLIDPEAGVDPKDPRANRIAQKDVETALANWGKYEVLMGPEAADLIIVVRKGHGRLADATISDPDPNNRPGVINPTDSGVMVGVQHGKPPVSGTPMSGGIPSPQTTGRETEIGPVDDSFEVFEGGPDIKQPLVGAPAWRYIAKNGLHSHNVPAVVEFRKAVTAAEIAAGAKKP
jgi:hypothetical protein